MSDSEGPSLRGYILRRRRRLAASLGAVAGVGLLVVGALLATHVIEVRVAPDDADATLQHEGGILVAMGRRVLLYSEAGVVTVSAPGFAGRSVEVSRENPERRVAVRLDPLPGQISIMVDSERAFLVRVDDRIMGAESPLRIELSPGTHAVAIEGPRIARLEADIDVMGRGAEQSFSFTPRDAPPVPTSELVIAARPAFARILIDGVPVGTGAYRGPVRMGVREIVLEADDHVAEGRRIEVKAGAGALELGTVTLRPLPASVSIDSEPSGAAVLVNGEYRGDTPLSIQLAAGDEQRVSVRKTGFATAGEALRPLPNARIERTFTLSREMYRAEVSANVPATVAVNGAARGSTPLVIDVVEGDTITATAPGRAAGPIVVRGGEGQARRYAFMLLHPNELAYREAASEMTVPSGIRLRKFPPLRLRTGGPDGGARDLELSRPFYFAIHETTAGIFRDFEPGFAPGVPADHPAASVTWTDAARFCNWLSAASGLPPAYELDRAFPRLDPASLGFRLPTEVEWEAAARYDVASRRTRDHRYPWGAAPQIPRAFANVAGRETRSGGGRFLAEHVDNHAGLAPVGSYPPNFNGIHDLTGNLSEWVNDYYRAGVMAPDGWRDPLGPPSGTDHVVKGGNHTSGALALLLPSHRDFVAHRSVLVGFRVARWIH